MTLKKVFAAVLAALIMLAALPTAALAAKAVKATTMRLARAEGEVEVREESGRKLTHSEGMQLYSGYEVETGEQSAADYLDGLLRENGLAAEVRKDIYSSDSIPFADNGVAGVNFARAGAPGAAFIHDRNDQLFFLSPEGLNSTLQIVALFTEHVVNSFVLPVATTIPEDIKEKVDKYLFKKK